MYQAYFGGEFNKVQKVAEVPKSSTIVHRERAYLIAGPSFSVL